MGAPHRAVRRRADVLVYFINDWEGFDNARSLSRRFRNE